SLSADRFTTTFAYLFVAIIHAALGVGIMTGVLADRGIVKMHELTFLNQLALLGISEFLYFIAFLTARISQRVTLKAVQRLEQAIRQVAQRDAGRGPRRARARAEDWRPGPVHRARDRLVQDRELDRTRRHGRGVRGA